MTSVTRAAVVAAIAVLALVVGCDSIDDLLGAGSKDTAGGSVGRDGTVVTVIVHPPPSCGSCGSSGTGAAGAATGFSCTPTLCDADGVSCSGLLATWSGPAQFVCARGHDGGLPDECSATAVSSPSTLDPGPPGEGGGKWLCGLESPLGTATTGQLLVELGT